MTEEHLQISCLGYPIIGFSGHRDRTCSPDHLFDILYAYDGAVWVHGGAKNGFDWQVSRFCKDQGIREVILRPQYAKYSQSESGKVQALLARNIEIVNIVKEMYFLYDDRQSGGTWYTLNYAKEQKKRYYLIALG